ncbi:MAG: HEAT repeat domain-containing protein [Planctomycetota bacterium]|nr:HEAT repeat domain-containing protein [Planctomycetota bacterium]
MRYVQYLWLLLSLDFWLIIGAPLALLVFLAWQAWRKRRLLPRQAARGDRTARTVETLALGGLSLSMFTLLVCYRNYEGTPYPLSELAPPTARHEYLLVLSGWTVFIAGALLLAWFHRTFLAAASLFLFFCVMGYAVNSGEILSYKGKEAEIRNYPVALQVKLKGDVVGADVWFNEVYLGKTPIVADLDEVLAKIPNWNETGPEEWTEFKHFLQGKHGVFRPRAWFYVNEPTRVGLDDSRDESRAIYARVELGGELLYAEGYHDVSGGSRIFGQIQPCRVTMDMFLPRWKDEIELLLNRARLSDYDVDHAWIEATASYGDAGWMKLREKSVVEPELNRVLDAWAAEVYGIDSVTDDAGARQCFDRICAEANELGDYYTDTPAGRALELILPQLHRDEMIDLAERRIRSCRVATSGSHRHGMILGRFHFGTYADGSWERAKLRPADAVLAHAIWRLDVAFDAEDDSVDNPIEERIVPALLRLDARRGSHFDMCQALGGSIFERFVLRHNWREQPEHIEDYNDKLTLSSVEWNRWMHVAATLRSPAGTEFRATNQRQLLELASKMVRDSYDFQHTWSTDSIDFLFLDTKLGPDSLAAQFWPTFDRYVTPERHSWSQAPGARWKYLARLQPHGTVEPFVASYRKYCDERCPKTELIQLEPNFQFEVLTALVVEANRLLAETEPNSSPHSIRQANRDEFAEMVRKIPCDKSAALLIEWLDEETDEHKNRIRRTRQLIEGNQLPAQQLSALADSDDPAVRSMVFSGIEQQATPQGRAILKQLLTDNDDTVRAQATDLHAKLEELRSQTLPKRDS